MNAKGDFIKNDDGEYQMEDHDTFVVDHLEEGLFCDSGFGIANFISVQNASSARPTSS
jgi:hypothetical protein